LGIEVAGVAGNGAARTAEKARQLGINRSYGSADEMLADPTNSIAKPPALPHAKAALLAGKHVVCEKPLAMDSRESGELVKLNVSYLGNPRSYSLVCHRMIIFF
jgi:predicted dehydrogenase